MKKVEPELVEQKDVYTLARLAPRDVLVHCAERFLPMIWNKVLSPERTRRAYQRPPPSGEDAFSAFVDLLWSRYRTMTGKQARSEAGALVAVFADVKPNQIVEQAMTRAQFRERYTAAGVVQ